MFRLVSEKNVLGLKKYLCICNEIHLHNYMKKTSSFK